jgi:hypothetical protein
MCIPMCIYSRDVGQESGGETKRQKAHACLYKRAIYVWNGFVESMVFEEFRGCIRYLYIHI